MRGLQSYPIPLRGRPLKGSTAIVPIMKLSTLLEKDRIILEMNATEHWAAITELVDRLVETGGLTESHRQDMLDAFKEREEQISTGIGAGVAIPHTFSDELEEVVAVLGRSQTGIDFQALDNAPVHQIILFIVPRKEYHLHLRTLAAIAKLFTNEEVRRALTKATNTREILDILDSKPSRNTTKLTLPPRPARPES